VEEVSDHALALLLACARKVAFYHQRTKKGEYLLHLFLAWLIFNRIYPFVERMFSSLL